MKKKKRNVLKKNSLLARALISCYCPLKIRYVFKMSEQMTKKENE